MSIKPPKRITAERLHNIALHYLDRFSSSKENLRRVLMRRVQKSEKFHGEDEGTGAALAAAEIARLEKAGLLDDAAYAEMKTRSLRQRGASSRMIRLKLAQKGVKADDTDTAMEEASGEGGGEKEAARIFARKRKIGPFRPEGGRAENRAKDLSTLARAGFSYDVARDVVDAESPEPV